jgi:hypothetical protein
MSGWPGEVVGRQLPLTDGGEVAAYVTAHVVKVAVAYAVAPFYANALFQWAYGRAGGVGLTVASLGQSVVWAVLGLVLFLALRPAFGAALAGLRAAGAGITAGFEIGAYALAQGIGIAAGIALFATVMPQLYAILGIHGRSVLLSVVSIGVGAVIAAAEFVLFILFRRSFAGSFTPGR